MLFTKEVGGNNLDGRAVFRWRMAMIFVSFICCGVVQVTMISVKKLSV